MKKTVFAVAAALVFGFGGYQLAEAQPMGGGAGMGLGGRAMMMGGGQMGQWGLSAKDQQAMEKFFSDTRELRRKMFSKQTELDAILSGANPDEKKAAALSEDLFEIRDQMQQKAREAGIAGAGWGMGCGMGAGKGQKRLGYGMRR